MIKITGKTNYPYVEGVKCEKANKWICEIDTQNRGTSKEDEITHISLSDVSQTDIHRGSTIKVEKNKDSGMICRVDKKEKMDKKPQFRRRELECKETEIGEDVSW